MSRRKAATGSRFGQNHVHINTVYIGIFWQGNHQMYCHIRCIYTVLANPQQHARTTAVDEVGERRQLEAPNVLG